MPLRRAPGAMEVTHCLLSIVSTSVMFSAAAAQGRELLAPAPSPSSTAVFVQPALPYAFDAQESFIDTETQTLHWTKHTATYFENLDNAILPFPSLHTYSLEALIPLIGNSTIPKNITTAVRNNAGGAYNHLLFFKTLKPATPGTNNTQLPPEIGGAIDKAFGNFSNFVTRFNASAVEVFGSGFAWLVVPKNHTLAIGTTPNQDNTLMTGIQYPGDIPILGIDVWEHAYYLKHQNRRPEYIEAWFNVVNWPQVNTNYLAALKGDKTPLSSYPTAPAPAPAG